MTGAVTFLDLITVLNISTAVLPRWTVVYGDRTAMSGMVNLVHCFPGYHCDNSAWLYHESSKTFVTSFDALEFINRDLKDQPGWERKPRLYMSLEVPVKRVEVGQDEIFKTVQVPEVVPRLEWQLGRGSPEQE